MSEGRILLLQRLDEGHYQSIDQLSCSYSGVENTALAQLPVDNPVLADDMFADITSPDIIIRLCTFLAYVSTPTAIGTKNPVFEDLALKPITSDLSAVQEVAVRLESMLNVSYRIQRYLGSNPQGEEVLKFNLMISYTMLHLTLEYGIVPAMQAEDNNIGPQEINRKKLPLLCEKLTVLHGSTIKIGSLKEKIRYGKVLWELVCAAGVMILPVLAVAGPGITVLAHKFGVQSNQIALLGARLAANNMWMSLCQALSPIAVELIFTYSTRTYTRDDLLNLVIQEPLPRCLSSIIYEQYLEQEQKGDLCTRVRIDRVRTPLSHQIASKVLAQFGLHLALFPADDYQNPASHQVKLVEWLLLEDEAREVELPVDRMANNPRSRQLSLGIFASLLDPSKINDRAVGYLAALWNQRAMPGWGILSPYEAYRLVNGDLGSDPVAAVTLALGGRRFSLHYQNVLLPLVTPQMVFPFLVSLINRTATLYYLAGSDAAWHASGQLIQVRNC